MTNLLQLTFYCLSKTKCQLREDEEESEGGEDTGGGGVTLSHVYVLHLLQFSQ